MVYVDICVGSLGRGRQTTVVENISFWCFCWLFLPKL